MNAKNWITIGLLLLVRTVFAANYQVPVGTGSSVNGGLSNAYSFSGGFTTSQATNVALLPAISNLALNQAFTNTTQFDGLTNRNASKTWTNRAATRLEGQVDLLGVLLATNGNISLLNDGFNMTLGTAAGVSFVDSYASINLYGGLLMNTPGQRAIIQDAVTLEVQNGSSFQVGTSSAIGTTPAFIRIGTNDYLLFDGHVDPPTSASGRLYFDTDHWAASRGALQFHDGTANTMLIAVLKSDTPSNGQVPKYNSASGTFTLEDDNTGGGSSGPVYQGSVYSNHVENVFGVSSTVTLYGTNQQWRNLQTSNETFAVSGLQSNVTYELQWTNNASTITWPGTIRWWDGATMSSAPALSGGSYILNFWLNESGTNGRVVSGPVYLLAAGYKTELLTNSTTGTITSQSTQRYTNYASASITINCATDVTANYTNAVAANNTITLATPVIGTSGSLGLVSDGSARTLAILSPVAITWLSTNDTATATNILTTASKRSLFAWRVGMGTDGVSTNIQCWVKNQTP